jgi:protein involved in polysaccharide export with SLBB domain
MSNFVWSVIKKYGVEKVEKPDVVSIKQICTKMIINSKGLSSSNLVKRTNPLTLLNFYMKSFFTLLTLLVTIAILCPTNAHAQAVNQAVVAQVRSILTSKGLDENEVKSRLMSKGIDVEKMTPEELVKNKATIEQIVNEMEAENKSTKTPGNASSVKSPASPIDTVIINNVPVEVSKKEAAADNVTKAVQETVSPSAIYGHKMFKEKSLEVYRVSKDASPPENYVLAPGDKINILIFGRSQADLNFEINSAGFIQPSQMPKIFLSGLTLKQAKEMLISRFSTYYVFDAGQFVLTLNTSRTLTVNVFGEVERAGSYTTSALNTALTALSVSGGPSEIGSVRNIQIIRGSTRKTLDVYAFMRNPLVQYDYYLQNNDIIYVPPADKLITLEGAVNRQMQFELKQGEGLKELLEYAGGLKVDAYTEFLQVQRIENNKIVLNDHKLNDILNGKSVLELRNGDIVRIRSINAPLKSFVKISGAVQYVGNYDLSSTPTIKSLIEKARILPEAKKDQAFLIRKKLDQTSEVISVPLEDILAGKKSDINLQQEDSVLVYEQSRYVDQFGISVVGEVRNPFERSFRYDQSISIQEAIELAGGLKPVAANFGYIYRTNPFNAKKTEYIAVDFKQDFKQSLKPGDKLVILNKDAYELESTVAITGDVAKPVVLRYDASLNVKDLIRIAGGLTVSSNPQFVEVFRLNFAVGQAPTRSLINIALNDKLEPGDASFNLQPFDVVVVRRTTDFNLQEVVEVTGEVQKAGPFAKRSNRYHFSDLIQDAGGFTDVADVYNVKLIRYADSTGIVAFNAEDAMKNKSDLKKDPILVEGDYVIVPKFDNTVTIEADGTNYVLGADQKYLTITYQGLASSKKYINKYAAGFADREGRKYIRVIRQSGLQEASRKGFLFTKHPMVKPGDRIAVSFLAMDEKQKRQVKPLDWDKFVTRILAAFTTLALIQAYVK